ncbi:1-phosphatidylinositol 4,5-bisphosphate phosphodiesterase delta-1a [Aplochiton taeniatus]
MENGKAGKHGLEGDLDLQFLLLGGELLKVRSVSWRKPRYYKLQEDCKTMWYESRKTIKSSQTFSLDDIETVRSGRQSEGFQKYTEPGIEDRCFSIIFKERQKNLDLVAVSAQEAQQWIRGLDKVIVNMRKLNPQQKSEHWIFTCMRKADKNNDNKMTLKEMKKFLRKMNITVDDVYATELFEKCDTSRSGTLEDEEIKQFYDLLTHREEIDVVYQKYAKAAGQMSTKDLMDFLTNEQREKATVEGAVHLIEKYELDEMAKQKKHMTKDGFLMYMQGEDSAILNLAHKEVFQDMNQPLNHYFISSSHNTYLMEDQLKGPSSTEAYIRALMQSCRCVELDCWDGANGEPVVYHGYTLTSKVLFKDVIKAIKEYAFKTSQYPVILSLENHCTMSQQPLMAQHMRTILGSALLSQPLEETMPSCFPSPEELKGKFLIKGKRLNKLDAVFNNNNNIVEEDCVSEEDEAAETKENAQKNKSKKSKMKLAKGLSDLVIYCKSVHFTSFEHAKNNHNFYEMASFKESKALNLSEISANGYIHHNIDKLSRIYPAGSRTDSSNYNPVTMWNSGCQIVALNFQTPGKEMDLNRGLFLPNGQCGYNLKPQFLRDSSTQFDPIRLTSGPWLKQKSLHVMVISAQQLPKVKTSEKSIIDPLVKVEIFGVPSDSTSKETHYIANNGFNPMWNENFAFTIRVPELAMMRFKVVDYDPTSPNDFIGQYTLPLTSVKCGYRNVPLLTKRGAVIPSAGLFLHLMLLDVQ